MITVVPIILGDGGFCKLFKKNMEKKGIKFISYANKFNSFFKGSNVDIVHFQWLHIQFKYETLFSTIFSSFSFFKHIIKLKKQGLRYCWTIHNIQPHENKRPIINFINYFLMSKIADSIIVLSDLEKKEIKKFFLVNDNKIFLAPHGNYIGYNKNECSKFEARKKLKIPKNKFVYLFFGCIRRYKGVVELIKIFKEIKKKNDILLIAGKINDLSLKEEIINLKDDSIILDVKYIEEDEVQYYMNASDVVIFPFKKITNSGSLLLAMSFGKPVICINKGSPSEIIKNDFGILYNEGELGKAIVEIKNRNLKQMGKKSYEEAKKYDWNEIAEKYIKAYEYALKEKNGSN